jgi:hypothetical protein
MRRADVTLARRRRDRLYHNPARLAFAARILKPMMSGRLPPMMVFGAAS